MNAEQSQVGAHHVLPVATYLKVYVALVALTALTVAVSYADLGPASIWAAMAVAVAKASLVVSIFMHLKYSETFNRLVFVSSLLFVLMFFGFTMIDLSTRDAVLDVKGNFVPAREAQLARQATGEETGTAPAHH